MAFQAQQQVVSLGALAGAQRRICSRPSAMIV